jgi:hypothetical protein
MRKITTSLLLVFFIGIPSLNAEALYSKILKCKAEGEDGYGGKRSIELIIVPPSRDFIEQNLHLAAITKEGEIKNIVSNFVGVGNIQVNYSSSYSETHELTFLESVSEIKINLLG